MIQREHYHLLRKHPAFEHLGIEIFDKLASEMKYRKIPKGQILFFDGDKRERLFFLLKGYVRIEQYDKTASFSYVDFVKENALFPIGGLFTDEYYHYTAVAVTGVEYVTIPVAVFEEYSRKETAQLLYFIRELSKILEFHEFRLRNAALAGARDRVIQALSVLCLDFCKEGEEVPFPISTIDLSRLAATTRETVHQVMKQLKADEKILYERKRMIFLDKAFFLEVYKSNQ